MGLYYINSRYLFDMFNTFFLIDIDSISIFTDIFVDQLCMLSKERIIVEFVII